MQGNNLMLRLGQGSNIILKLGQCGNILLRLWYKRVLKLSGLVAG